MYLVAPGWPFLYVPTVTKYMVAWSAKFMSPKQSSITFLYINCLSLSEAQGAMYLVTLGWPFFYVPTDTKYTVAWSAKLLSPPQSSINFPYINCLLHLKIHIFLLQITLSDAVPL